ncbi:hypothetical protein WJX81_003208 [Elliptochloris bilobata]|uniref:Uncharacterized protein n=1 Tax=Elliptochloris bilobata TaxID=381761 RepID=A0AAW1S4V7_9CHLO
MVVGWSEPEPSGSSELLQTLAGAVSPALARVAPALASTVAASFLGPHLAPTLMAEVAQGLLEAPEGLQLPHLGSITLPPLPAVWNSFDQAVNRLRRWTSEDDLPVAPDDGTAFPFAARAWRGFNRRDSTDSTTGELARVLPLLLPSTPNPPAPEALPFAARAAEGFQPSGLEAGEAPAQASAAMPKPGDEALEDDAPLEKTGGLPASASRIGLLLSGAKRLRGPSSQFRASTQLSKVDSISVAFALIIFVYLGFREPHRLAHHAPVAYCTVMALLCSMLFVPRLSLTWYVEHREVTAKLLCVFYTTFNAMVAFPRVLTGIEPGSGLCNAAWVLRYCNAQPLLTSNVVSMVRFRLQASGIACYALH